MRKMTHGASGSLICHGVDKGQGLSRGRANVVHPTPLEAADGGTLVGGHELPVAPDNVTQICCCLFFGRVLDRGQSCCFTCKTPAARRLVQMRQDSSSVS